VETAARGVNLLSTRAPARGGGASGYVRAVLRFLSGGALSLRPSRSPSMLPVVRMLVLAAALATVPFTTPDFFRGARGVADTITLAICAIGWVVWMSARDDERAPPPLLIVLAAAGGVLAGLSTLSLAMAVGCVVTASAAIRMSPDHSFAVTAEVVACFLVAGLAAGASVASLVGYACAFVGLWALGLTRHQSMMRAEEAERRLEQTRRAREAETQAAALTERARLAREIHDVLAHSLAAVSVNLQAAEGLLAGLPDQSPELTKALECIERAGAFTREGLTEARHAINALRDNTSPLPEQLEALAARYGAAGDAQAAFSLAGSPRPVPADVNLTTYRAAQEALTNARKHSPGQPVRLRLEFASAEITLLVTNPLPHHVAAPSPDAPASAPPGGRPSLASTGGGHGLTGLRERAALSGGTLSAGPDAGQWRVCLRIPA
jgi:signal transduction histidine kinase